MLVLVRRLGLCLLLLLLMAPAQSQTQVVRIGVLSFLNKSDTLAQWGPTAQQLARDIPGHDFQVQALNYDELNTAVLNGSVDFVVTNPEHYVVLRNVYSLSPMVTLTARIDGQVVNRMGGVIFARRDRDDIQVLADVRGKRVAAVALYSLGGYLAAADVFKQAHIDLQSQRDVAALTFVDTPHSRVVDAVLAGRADVGVVRTGVLEQMVERGTLDLNQVRVINLQPEAAFPQWLSTDLYPEWPIAAMPQTDAKLVKMVTVALLRIDAASESARAGRHAGFSPPANYAAVEELMRRLEVYPGVKDQPLLEALWQGYRSHFQAAALLALVLVLGVASYLWRSNRELRRSTSLLSEAQARLEVTSAAFDSQVGLIVTDPFTHIVRANAALCEMLGYRESELLGRTTAQLRGANVPDGKMERVWRMLQEHGQWRGELQVQHAVKDDLTCLVTITQLRGTSGRQTGFVGSFSDVSKLKAVEADFRKLAYFDPLTELANRRLFMERIALALESSQRSDMYGAVMFLDLDQFKVLNDHYGHFVGDELLRIIAARLQALCSGSMLAARLGGDEFVLTLENVAAKREAALAQALQFAQRVREAVLAPMSLQADIRTEAHAAHTIDYVCTTSVGVAVFGPSEQQVSEVLKQADVALYQAKQAGRNVIRNFDSQSMQWLRDKLALTHDLSAALARNEFELHFQAQVDPQGHAIGAECLLRWKHGERGMVPPGDFIPIAEESGLIVPIGEWVLQRACECLAAWSVHPHLRDLRLSVNVSPRQFREAGFLNTVSAALERTGAPAPQLVLEITEGLLLENKGEVVTRMRALRQLGLRFSIDDFGTGYSSLSYLHELPLSELKIDRAFVRNLIDDRGSRAIVGAIVALAQNLDLEIVSEGVETRAQWEVLLNMGVRTVQGFYVARPQPRAIFESWVVDT